MDAEGLHAGNLTEIEISALPAEYNLCDGHAYRTWTPEERVIVERAATLMLSSDRREQGAIEAKYLEAFFRLMKIPHPIADFHFFFTASMGIEAIANYLRLRNSSVALIEPCFDNLGDILRRHNLPLARLEESMLYSGSRPFESHEGLASSDAVFIVSPNNPTGAAMSAERFNELAEYCASTKKLLVLDACFRFYALAESPVDHYEILSAHELDWIVLEDTGKTWPSLELKAPFLAVSAGVEAGIRRVRNDFLLHVSPFTIKLMTEFVLLALEDGGTRLRAVADRNRRTLTDEIDGLPLSIVDSALLGIAWCKIEVPVSSAEVARLLASKGVHVLSGHRFFWFEPQLGDQFIRISLVRDEVAFNEAARLLAAGCGELLGAITDV